MNTGTANMEQAALQAAISKNIASAKDVHCDNCGGLFFIPSVAFKTISKLAMGTSNDAIIPIEINICANCGKPLTGLLPESLRTSYEPTGTGDPTSNPEAEQNPTFVK